MPTSGFLKTRISSEDDLNSAHGTIEILDTRQSSVMLGYYFG
jgi:hypothetical protein